MRTAITDLRGKGRWMPSDYVRKADLWIVGSSWTEKPVAGARTLAHLSATYLTLDGAIMGPPGSLNDVIGRTLKPLPVQSPLWTSADGRQALYPVDLTQRHATNELADIVTKRMAAFDGVEIDYFGFGWAYPELGEDFWLKFDRNLRSWVEQMRALRPDWVFIGQMHHLTEPCGALNGLYNEVDMTSFGTTLEAHTADVVALKSLARMSGREVVYVAELRDPLRYPAWYVERYRQWCVDNGAFASVGRDSTAMGAA